MEGRLKAEEALKGLHSELGLSKTMQKSSPKSLGALQTRFNETNKIWCEEVGKLLDHLKAQQRGMPSMVAQKVFLSMTFGDFINKCSTIMVDAAITTRKDKARL